MTPGESERATSELSDARDALRAAVILFDEGLTADGISRLYYATFHAARSALTSRSVWAKTHSGQIDRFRATFGAAPVLVELFNARLQADYGEGRFIIDEAKRLSLVSDAQDFVERCQRLVEEQLAAGPDEPDPPPDL